MLRSNGHLKQHLNMYLCKGSKETQKQFSLFDQWRSMVLKDVEYLESIFKNPITRRPQADSYKCFFVAWDRCGILKMSH